MTATRDLRACLSMNSQSAQEALGEQEEEAKVGNGQNATTESVPATRETACRARSETTAADLAAAAAAAQLCTAEAAADPATGAAAGRTAPSAALSLGRLRHDHLRLLAILWLLVIRQLVLCA